MDKWEYSYLTELKTLWEKEKLLVTSNFSFSHNVFKSCLLLMCQNEYLWSKGLYHGGQCTYPCFPGILLTVTPHSILSKPLAAFPQTIAETMDSNERGMNLLAMTIISPRKEYWLSRGSN